MKLTIQQVQFTAYQAKQNTQLSLATFSGMAESEQGSSSSMTTSRQEEDEILNQMVEDERLLDESDGEEKQTNTDQKEKAADAARVSSVGHWQKIS